MVVFAALLVCAVPVAHAESIGIEPDFSADQALPFPEPAAPQLTQPADLPQADLRTMLGQMLIVGFIGAGTDGNWVRTVRGQITDGAIGGVFFLKRNIQNRAQLTALTQSFRRASNGPPPFISVDQEGGFVQRLTRANGFTLIPSALRMVERQGPERAREIYRLAASELAAAGFNLNFAPVIDLNVNPSNPVIGRVRRSYSPDPDTVAHFARILIDEHRRYGIATSLKHFPGHGSSTTDSHEVLVDISATWRDTELAPYRGLISEGYADMVMVGHLYTNALEPRPRHPASLSPALIDGVLRGELNHNGVVITDDLDMKAIRRNHDFREIVVSAIRAGNDILLFSQTASPKVDLPERVLAAVEEAIASGELTTARIARSYARILALKNMLAWE